MTRALLLARLCRRLATGAFGAAAAVVGVAQAAGTLTVCVEAAPEGFDIVQYETAVTNDIAGVPLYDQLLSLKPGTTEVAPGLAERWEVSADGLAYTLHLRRGVKFHSTAWFKPTRDFDADDVLWSIERINDKSHPAHGVAKSGYPYWAGMSMHSLIAGVEKRDPHTVVVRLTRPEAPFLANLTMSAIASVYSAEYAAQLAKAGQPGQINTQPIGTGPFQFQSYQKDAVVRLAANPAYWGGVPPIDKLVFAITPDSSVRAQRARAGECAVAEVLPDVVDDLAKDPKLAIVRNQPLMTSYVALNNQHPFLRDVRFREALALAVDKPAFIQGVYSGGGKPASTFLPPGIWSSDASLVRAHDVDKARGLVKESGYDGRELTLFATSRSSDIQRGVALLQADFARIGVKVQVRMMELGELYKRTGQGEHDLALLSWYSDNGDPDNFFTPNLACAAVAGGGNKSRWCNAAFDALLDQARRAPGLAQRGALYRQAQKLLFDDVGLIPLANKQQLRVIGKQVQGMRLTPFGNMDFRATRVQ